MSNTPSTADARRLMTRIAAHQILSLLTEAASHLDLDLLETLVFTAVWTANTEHLQVSASRYARLHDLPPDRVRRPVPLDQLAGRLRLSPELVSSTAERLKARHLVEQLEAGLIVPAAVFTRPQMLHALHASLDGLKGLNARLVALEPAADAA